MLFSFAIELSGYLVFSLLDKAIANPTEGSRPEESRPLLKNNDVARHQTLPRLPGKFTQETTEDSPLNYSSALCLTQQGVSVSSRGLFIFPSSLIFL